MIELEHPAIGLISQEAWQKLLVDCYTLDKFCGRIDRLAKKIAIIPKGQSNLYYHESGKDASNKFKGDVFEIFCEIVIRLSSIDDRIGISNYHIVTENDTGVDGYGIAKDGTSITVQIKYRLWDYELGAIKDHLNNFRLTSYKKFNIDPKDVSGKMLIITTGKEIGWKTLDRQFLGSIRCISRNASYKCIKGSQSKTIDNLFSLKTIVDNNIFFWTTFMDEVIRNG